MQAQLDTKRLGTIIGMMGATSNGGDGEGVNAYRLATRMLKGAGLTWSDIAERALRTPFGGMHATPSDDMARAQGFGSAFDDIFRGWDSDMGGRASAWSQRRDPHAERANAHARSQGARGAGGTRQRVSGLDVPASISGMIRIVDADRRWRGGAMLVFEVLGDHATYGPLVCFDEPLQARIRTAAASNAAMTLAIKAPRNEGQNPVATAG